MIDIGCIESNRQRAEILLESLHLLRPGDRHDVVALREQPGERDLGG